MKVVSFQDPQSRMPCCAIEGPHGKLAVFKFFGGEWLDASSIVVPAGMRMSPLELLACTQLLPESIGEPGDARST